MPPTRLSTHSWAHAGLGGAGLHTALLRDRRRRSERRVSPPSRPHERGFLSPPAPGGGSPGGLGRHLARRTSDVSGHTASIAGVSRATGTRGERKGLPFTGTARRPFAGHSLRAESAQGQPVCPSDDWDERLRARDPGRHFLRPGGDPGLPGPEDLAWHGLGGGGGVRTQEGGART